MSRPIWRNLLSTVACTVFTASMACQMGPQPGGGQGRSGDEATASQDSGPPDGSSADAPAGQELPATGDGEGGVSQPGGIGDLGLFPPGFEIVPCDDTPQPFDEGEPWFLTNDPFDESAVVFNIAGFGTSVESALIAAVATPDDVCVSDGASLSVEFDGRTVRIEGDIANDGLGPVCSISLSGTVRDCGVSFFGPFPLPANVLDVDVSGSVTVGGREMPVSSMRITRIPPPQPVPCDEDPGPLVDQQWVLESTNPRSFRGDTGDGPFVRLTGEAESLAFGELFSPESDAPGCFSDLPSGSVSFDGTTLRVETEIEADPFFRDSEIDAAPCTLDFSGTVSNCELVDEFQFFPCGGRSIPLLRIDGEGTFRSAGAQASLPTLFLTLRDPLEPTEDLCSADLAPLADDDAWRLSATDPFAAPRGGPPTSLRIEGQGDQATFIEVPRSAAEIAPIDIAFGTNPEGTLALEGETLVLDLRTTDPHGSDLTVAFRGTLADCRTRVDEDVFFSCDDVAVLRFIGTGEVTTDEDITPLDELFFVRTPVPFFDDEPFPRPVRPPVPVLPATR